MSESGDDILSVRGGDFVGIRSANLLTASALEGYSGPLTRSFLCHSCRERSRLRGRRCSLFSIVDMGGAV
jgi:hypothetical protein